MKALRPGVLLALACAGLANAGPIVKPSAPGSPSRSITPDESARLGEARATPADVRFMQDMIMHHAQAVEMVDLIAGRSTNTDLALFARRIAMNQAGEITMMERWLVSRGQPAESPHAHPAMTMAGMLTPTQMDALRAARGVAFDRLFLTGMIQHHQGAIQMTNELGAEPGAAEEPELNNFVAGIVPDQSGEILTMRAMLQSLRG